MEPKTTQPRILTGDCGRRQRGMQGNSMNLYILLVNVIQLSQQLTCSGQNTHLKTPMNTNIVEKDYTF